MRLSELETWLGEVACTIPRGSTRPSILPLVFLKHRSDVFDNELAWAGNAARYLNDGRGIVRFYLPPEAELGNR